MAKDYLNDYDATAGNNTDVGGVNINEGCAPSGINNAIREVMSHLAGFKPQFEAGANIASASALSVNIAGLIHDVTGTTTITSLANPTNDTSHVKILQFAGALTLTDSGNLILPSGNITTVAGDVAIFAYEGSSVWRCVSYFSASLDDISGLAKTNGNFIVGNGSNWVAESGATARTSLGLDQAVIDQGVWDASAGTFPGSGLAQTGALYRVSVAGTVDSQAFAIGDAILAITDDASTGTYASNWFAIRNIDTAEITKLGYITVTQAVDLDAMGTAIDASAADATCVKFDASENSLFGKSSQDYTSTGVEISTDGLVVATRSGNLGLLINRTTSDGSLATFRRDNVEEGSISVSGSTVSYNGAHLSRLSQWEDGPHQEKLPALRGTVLSNRNKMCNWKMVEWEQEIPVVLDEEGQEVEPSRIEEGKAFYDGLAQIGETVDYVTEKGLEVQATVIPKLNEQLNTVMVSNSEGDLRIAGVFQGYIEEDERAPYDFNIAMTGDFVIRIKKDTVLDGGELLISAGDGTAIPQSDDILRASTVARVTSNEVTETYDDGSFLVPCLLMAC